MSITVFEGIEAAADLPELTAGEVLVADRVFHRYEDDKRYHTDRHCRHLKQASEVHLADAGSVSGWDECRQCWRRQLPDRGGDEVWVRGGVNDSQINSYHIDASCYRLRDIDRPKTMSKAEARNGGAAKCQYCDGQVAFENRPRLVDVLRANPDMHYDDVVHQWRQRRDWSPTMSGVAANQEATDE